VSPGPFASGEIRTYTVANLCGLPAASKGLKAVSIAITKIPLGSSPAGDIETVPTGTPLGNTVVLVVEAGLWSSVSKIVRVDANGAFDMQMRNTLGHVAIDVNGYFIDTSTATSADFYSIRGAYSQDPGGLLYSENSSATGAAIRGLNSGGPLGATLSDVLLSAGTNAIDILEGQIRVRGAGNGTSTPAFIHLVGAGNLCTDTRYTRLDETHVSPPNSSAGQMLFVQEAARTGSTDTTTPKAIRTVFLTSFNCNGTLLANSWYLFTNGAFANNETYNVLLINP
jgi:hypothetical protein